MVGWSANAPSGSISCSAGDAAPRAAGVAGMGRQFSYGSLVREREKDPVSERELAGRPFGLRVAQHPELGGYGLWLRQPGGGGNPPDATAGRVDQR